MRPGLGAVFEAETAASTFKKTSLKHHFSLRIYYLTAQWYANVSIACYRLSLHTNCLESLMLLLVPKIKTGTSNFPSTKVNRLEASGVERGAGRMLVVMSAGICGIKTGRDIVLLSQGNCGALGKTENCPAEGKAPPRTQQSKRMRRKMSQHQNKGATSDSGGRQKSVPASVSSLFLLNTAGLVLRSPINGDG